MEKILNPRFWIIITGILNLLFGAFLAFGSSGSIEMFSDRVGGNIDNPMHSVTIALHEALGVTWALFGNFIIIAGIRNNKPADAARAAIVVSILIGILQANQVYQISTEAIPINPEVYFDFGINVFLIIMMLVSSFIYKNKESG